MVFLGAFDNFGRSILVEIGQDVCLRWSIIREHSLETDADHGLHCESRVIALRDIS